jgi:hypothetical protein
LITEPCDTCSRSHTAYTKFALLGSAVIEFLSFRKRPAGSVTRRIVGSQVRPPFVDRL